MSEAESSLHVELDLRYLRMSPESGGESLKALGATHSLAGWRESQTVKEGGPSRVATPKNGPLTREALVHADNTKCQCRYQIPSAIEVR